MYPKVYAISFNKFATTLDSDSFEARAILKSLVLSKSGEMDGNK